MKALSSICGTGKETKKKRKRKEIIFRSESDLDGRNGDERNDLCRKMARSVSSFIENEQTRGEKSDLGLWEALGDNTGMGRRHHLMQLMSKTSGLLGMLPCRPVRPVCLRRAAGEIPSVYSGAPS